MYLFTVIVIAVLVVTSIFLLSTWVAHIAMTTDDSKKSGWASYKTFKKWFNCYQWKGDEVFKGSLWNRELDCKFHAGIIKFEGLGMKINNPISYFLTVLFVRRYIVNKGETKSVSFKEIHSSNTKSQKNGYLVHLPGSESIFVSMDEIYATTEVKR